MTTQFAQHVKEVGDHDFYNSVTLTTLYVEVVFGGQVSTINLTNDSTTDTAQFSFDGATLQGEVKPGESVKVNVHQRPSIFVRGTAGGDTLRVWSYVDVSASSVSIAFTPLSVVNKTYEDASFLVGDSPFTIDFNDDTGRNSKEGWIINDGPGDFTVQFSRDGVTFGEPWTMKTGELTNVANFDIDTLILTRVGDSAYRVVLI